jgi:hypothetical protein
MGGPLRFAVPFFWQPIREHVRPLGACLVGRRTKRHELPRARDQRRKVDRARFLARLGGGACYLSRHRLAAARALEGRAVERTARNMGCATFFCPCRACGITPATVGSRNQGKTGERVIAWRASCGMVGRARVGSARPGGESVTGLGGNTCGNNPDDRQHVLGGRRHARARGVADDELRLARRATRRRGGRPRDRE